MYAGRGRRAGHHRRALRAPAQEYTKSCSPPSRSSGRAGSGPRRGPPPARPPQADGTEPRRSSRPTGLRITYPGRLGRPGFTAVDGVSFRLRSGEVLGLVGESGSGKTTIGRAIAGLTKVTGGSLRVLGQEMRGVKERTFRPLRGRHRLRVPGPGLELQPAADHRRLRRRAAGRARPRRRPRAPPGPGSTSCSRRSSCRGRTATATRTSSAAASGSGPASPGRWRSTRSC